MKKYFKIVFLALFSFLGVFMAGKVSADYFTSFEASEGYSVGPIDGQNGWTSQYPTINATSSIARSGSNSVWGNFATYYNWLKSPEMTEVYTDYSEISFWLYATSSVSDYVDLFISQTPTSTPEYLGAFDFISDSSWINFLFQFRDNGTSTSYRYRIAGASFSGWISSPVSIDFQSFYFYKMVNIYIDDFSKYQSSSLITGDITPTFPAPAITNYVYGTRFYFTGSYNYEISEPQQYVGIAITLTNTTTPQIFNWSLWDTHDVSATSSGTYGAYFDIPSGTWSVNYWIRALDLIGVPTDYEFPQPETWLVVNGSSLSTTTFPEVYTPEDCSGYALLERLVCEIKNFFNGAFLPSNAKVQSLFSTLDSVKNRAPYTYVNAMRTFFGDLNVGSTTEVLSISVFGSVASSTNFSIFDADVDGQSLRLRLRDIFDMIILIGFSVWLIYFLTRLFK